MAIVGFAYGVITLLLFTFQHRLVYLPDLGRDYAATPADAGMKHVDQEIVSADGERLAAWLIDAAGPDPDGHGVLLYFHGNAGSLGARLETVRVFHELGWRTLIVSYRGYGRSTGAPDEAGTYRDAEAAWRHLTGTLGVAPDRVVIYGESLGGGVGIWLAAREPVAGLITIGTFTSIPDLGQSLYPWIPVRLLARIRYDNLATVSRLRAPVLLIHSRDDEVVPFSHAGRLAEAAGQAGIPVTLLELRGGHNTAFRASGDVFRDGVARFLTQHREARQEAGQAGTSPTDEARD